MKPCLALLAIVLGAALLAAAPAPAVTLRPGDLVILDNCAGHNRVYHVDHATGAMSWVAAARLLADPSDVAVHPDGRILVADRTNGVVAIDPATGAQSVLSSGGLFSGGWPGGIAVAPDGDILVSVDFAAGAGTPAIVRVDSTGASQSIVTSGGFLRWPRGMAIATDGTLFVCDPDGQPATPYTGAYARGTIVRIALVGGTQLGQIESEQLSGPFDADWSVTTGRLAEVHAGIMGPCYGGGALWVDPVSGPLFAIGGSGNCFNGIAVGSDGELAFSGMTVLNHDPGDCYVSAGGRTFSGVGGPLAVVPTNLTPTVGVSWGRIKALYR
ncbi:MAG: hypothetical protein HZC42_04220 [Candidatus Eisenbacteria bacterium]|nr:hypothetical protein [Candidatus Eisenbacteria bacterium]